jgi:cytochrome c-type biogenesis protein CcmH
MKAVVLLLLLHGFVAWPVQAVQQESDLDRRTREVASQLRCPVCQGLSINDSPAELAVEMKGVVREQLAAGKTPEEIRQYFIAKYGEWVLLEPDPRGLNLLVYLLPVLGVLGGALFVWWFVSRATQPDEAGTAAS